MVTVTSLNIWFLLFMTTSINMNNGYYPTDCNECIAENELPNAVEEYCLINFFLTIYQHFICAPIIWQWAIFYIIIWFLCRYFFEFYYYPFIITKHYNFDIWTINQIKTSSSLNYSYRAGIAANKFVSFIAALLTVIRCTMYIYHPSSNWNNEYLWNSIYIPSPQPILDLLDSFLGYFVFDTIYLVLYSRRWIFLIHHLVVPMGTIGVKSFGYGAMLGLPIFLTADATTIFLNIMWFAQDHVKYLKFAIDCNKKNALKLENAVIFWKYIVLIIQLIFGISFIYLRLGQLSYLCIPWVINVVYSKHCNLFYKLLAVIGNAALLGTGYIWSIHVMFIMYKSLKKLIAPTTKIIK